MKLKKIIISLLSISLVACHSGNQKTVGIVVPVENKSLDQMVEGFRSTLLASNPNVSIKVSNAQGDMNMQHAIIDQFKNENVDIIVPIGTGATQMTLATAPNSTIVSLAANLTQDDRDKLKYCHVTVVHDEIHPKQLIQFIHQTYPELKTITLIHSASDKVYEDVRETVAAGKALGMTIKPLMINNLNDLYAIAHQIDSTAQGIFILKDLIVTSGIATIVQTAEKLKIPVFASDQGSVQDGATIAVGVHESEIGAFGAKLSEEVLAGKNACDLPLVDMKNLTIFVNQTAFAKSNLSMQPITASAKKLNYRIENVGEKTS